MVRKKINESRWRDPKYFLDFVLMVRAHYIPRLKEKHSTVASMTFLTAAANIKDTTSDITGIYIDGR